MITGFKTPSSTTVAKCVQSTQKELSKFGGGS
jgi:hypothetical protein